MLVQTPDDHKLDADELKVVTERQPTKKKFARCCSRGLFASTRNQTRSFMRVMARPSASARDRCRALIR